MDNAQKAIMIGVGLFITIIIISAVLLITNLGTGLIGGAQTQLGTISTSLQNQILQSYDGKVMSGTEVLAAARQYENSTEIAVVIYNVAQNEKLAQVADANIYQLGRGAVTVEPLEIGLVGGITIKEEGDLEPAGSTYTGVAQALNTRGTYRSSYVMEPVTNNVVGVAFIQVGTAEPAVQEAK
ncbi:MAG: hypothetical protein IJ272_09180 [Clostridia bacterium]|nr:hypothetical protein [Clostridia bacterium]